MKKNYIRQLLVAMTMLLCSVTVSAYDFMVDSIYYNITSDATVEITGGENYSGEIVIPSTITYDEKTYSVTSIGDYAFYGCTGLTNVTIGNSVTSIGERAFNGCTGLTNVTIGNSVTSIGERAFNGCTGLTNVTIGNSVTSIGENAFNGCTGLIAVHISDLAVWCNIDFENYNSNPLRHAKNLYLNGDLVKDFIIPEGVENIKNYAFSDCTGLTNVTIGNSVTSIGEWAFLGCSNLTSVTIGNSVTSIGERAFNGCTGLTNVTIGNSVTSIGDYAFYGCTGLTNVTIGNSVTSIGERAFYDCTGLRAVINFSNLTFSLYSSSYGHIAYYAFKVINVPNCSVEGDFIFRKIDSVNTLCGYIGNDTAIVLPNNYNGENYVIERHAFYGCSSLTSVTIPNSVTNIGGGAFLNCSSLTSVTIPNSVTSLESGAFNGCSSLTSVIIPNSVTSLGNGAFYGCSSLTSVTIPNSVTNIERSAFEGCSSLTEVHINSLSAWCKIDFTTDGYILHNGASLYLNGEEIIDLVIPEDVTEITFATFRGGNFKSVTIPGNVTKIGGHAFYGCTGLTSITIPNSVTSIGSSAFYGCTGLTSVTIGKSVTSIGLNAFYDCSNLTKIFLLNETPVTFNSYWSNPFSNYDATLYVPQGSIEAYKAADVWGDFANIVEFEVTGIEDVEDDAPSFEITGGGIQFTAAEGKCVAVYTTSGALVEKIDSYAGEYIALGKGVYVVRVGEKAVKVKL